MGGPLELVHVAGEPEVDLRSVLRDVALFSGVSDEDMSHLRDIARRLSIPTGAAVFEEGAPGDSMYVLLSGRLRVSHVVEDVDVEIATLSPGDHFGEVAILDSSTRTAAVRALMDSELLEIGRESFLGLLTTSPQFMTSVLGVLSRTVRSETDRYSFALAQQTIERVQSEVERHRSISQMVAGVAHEINTPLGIANQAASVVAELISPDTLESLARDDEAREVLRDVAEAVSLIARNVARASGLVAAFKNLSAREASGVIEPVDLGSVIGEVVELYSGRARGSGMEIDVVDGRDDPSRLWTGHPGALSQALLNLLINAERYAYLDGTGTVRIELSDAVCGTVRGFDVTVRDFGSGIPPEDLGKVFEPFFTTGRHRGGTGLGLSIVHNLLTGTLGGTVSIDSEVGNGTAVHLWIPDPLMAA